MMTTRETIGSEEYDKFKDHDRLGAFASRYAILNPGEQVEIQPTTSILSRHELNEYGIGLDLVATVGGVDGRDLYVFSDTERNAVNINEGNSIDFIPIREYLDDSTRQKLESGKHMAVALTAGAYIIANQAKLDALLLNKVMGIKADAYELSGYITKPWSRILSTGDSVGLNDDYSKVDSHSHRAESLDLQSNPLVRISVSKLGVLSIDNFKDNGKITVSSGV